jgi:hypothetical protein
MSVKRPSGLARRGYLWVTLVFFMLSVVGHWVFAWFAYVDEQAAHGRAIEVSGYVTETLRDTFENWQSEFLQLMWQVAGLAVLLYVGSPQSKEGHERLEAKLGALLRRSAPEDAESRIQTLEARYPKR